MVKHVVMWNFSEALGAEKCAEIGGKIKKALEDFSKTLPGVVDFTVVTSPINGNRALVVDSTFTDEAALKTYLEHPEHVRIGKELVRPNTVDRAGADYTLP